MIWTVFVVATLAGTLVCGIASYVVLAKREANHE